MAINAIILDLDNTIYDVPSIGDELFASLYKVITESGEANGKIEQIEADLLRRPFQKVADENGFSDDLKERCLEVLRNLEYKGSIEPYPDYAALRQLPADKYLVTMGFNKLQHSKVDRMGIRKDFREVHIVDPETTNKIKKDLFAEIAERNGYNAGEVMVVGDDPESEIKGARELGMVGVVYDKKGDYKGEERRIESFDELWELGGVQPSRV